MKSIAGNLEQFTPARLGSFAQHFAHHHQPARGLPAISLIAGLRGFQTVGEGRPLPDPRHGAAQVRIHPHRNRVGQRAALQLDEKFSDEKARIRAQRVEPKTVRQLGQGLGQKGDDATRAGGIAAAQPGVQHDLGFGQHRQQWMMGGTPVFAWVVALETALLVSVALKYGGIQVQHHAQRRRAQPA